MMKEKFGRILENAHFNNWASDWSLAQEIYSSFPDSYSLLTPFAYAYLEELIRSTTSEYIKGHPKVSERRKTGARLIDLAIEENSNNDEYVGLLERARSYFVPSDITDSGDNRHGVSHGYLPPRFWTKESFEGLISLIGQISPFSRF